MVKIDQNRFGVFVSKFLKRIQVSKIKVFYQIILIIVVMLVFLVVLGVRNLNVINGMHN